MFRTMTCAAALAAIASSALAADMGRPAISPALPGAPLPQQHVMGYVEGVYTYGQTDGAFGDQNIGTIRGAINVPTAEGFNLQVDGRYSHEASEGFHHDVVGGALHGYLRGPVYAVGVFVDGDYVTGTGNTFHGYMGGLEGAYFLDNITLLAAAAVGQSVTPTNDSTDYFAKIGARAYASDNLRFDLEGGAKWVELAGGRRDKLFVEAAANYRLTAMPVTMFAGYRYDQLQKGLNGFTGDTDSNHYFAGLRYSFGSQSLKEEERAGPLW